MMDVESDEPPWVFSLGDVLGLILLAATSAAALAKPGTQWTATFVTLTMLVLFVSVARAVATRGSVRAFWTTFALIGSFYFLVTVARVLDWRDEFSFARDFLLTNQAVRLAHDELHLSTPGVRTAFYGIGHSMFALAFAVAFGFLARHFYLRSHRTNRIDKGQST